MDYSDRRIIITRKVWQLLAVIGVTLMAILSRSSYPFGFRSGLWLCGVAAGEFFWQNTRLKDLDETCRQRYWAAYEDSIF